VTNPNPNELAVDITNSNVAPIIIAIFHADWVKVAPSQKLSKLFLGGTNEIWNIADNAPPSDVPTEGNWNNNNRTISGGIVGNFIVQFQDPLEPGNYQLQITFDNGCQVTGAFIVP